MAIEKTCTISARLTPTTFAELKRLAEAHQVSRSEILRAAIDRVPPTASSRRAVPAELAELNCQLSRLGNNFNQQTRVLNQMQGRFPYAQELLTLLAQLREQLDSVAEQVAGISRS